MNDNMTNFSIMGYRLPIKKEYHGLFLIYHPNILSRVDDYHDNVIFTFSNSIKKDLDKKHDNDTHHYITKLFNQKFMVSFYIPNFLSNQDDYALYSYFQTQMKESIEQNDSQIVSFDYISQWENKYLDSVMAQIEKFKLENSSLVFDFNTKKMIKL